MANWSNPLITSTYTSVLDDLKNRDLDLALQFNPSLTTPTNVPTGAIRWHPTNGYWESYSGTAWAALIAKYMIDVDKLDGQDGAYYLNWNNLTNKPTTFAPSAHTHDDRYFTETESDARFANKLIVSSNQIKLQTFAGTDLSAITVPYATNAGNAGTVGGYNVDQNLLTTSSPTFAVLTLTNELRVPAGTAGDPSIASSDDANNDSGIYFPEEDVLAFSNGGAESMRLTALGRLGIATSNPAYALEVNGVISTTRFGTDPYFHSRRAGGTSAAPTATVSGNALGYFSAAGYGTTGFGSTTGAILFLASENFTDTAQGTEIRFQTTPVGSTTRATRMTIDDGGEVGIGTTTPSYLLHVNGSFNATTIAINGVAVTADAAELNKLNGVTSVTADLNLLSGAAAAGVTATRIQYLNSLTGNVQTQLNARLNEANPTFTGSMTGPLLNLTNTTAPTLTSTTHPLQTGPDSGANLRFGSNRIQSLNNGAYNTLALNILGGDVTVGASTSTIYLNGGVSVVKATDDTAAAPSYTWNSNTGLGMYRAGSTSIGWAIGGTNAMTLNGTNLLVYGDIVARFYNGSSAAQVDLPIGHVVVAYNNTTTPDRNASVTIRLDDANNTFYEYGTGTGALVGTWRSRGKIYGTDMFLMQRVA